MSDNRRLIEDFLPIQAISAEGNKGGEHGCNKTRAVCATVLNNYCDGFVRSIDDTLLNASFIGFTGTPIEETDANTHAATR